MTSREDTFHCAALEEFATRKHLPSKQHYDPHDSRFTHSSCFHLRFSDFSLSLSPCPRSRLAEIGCEVKRGGALCVVDEACDR